MAEIKAFKTVPGRDKCSMKMFSPIMGYFFMGNANMGKYFCELIMKNVKRKH